MDQYNEFVEERSDPDYHDDPELFLIQDEEDNI